MKTKSDLKIPSFIWNISIDRNALQFGMIVFVLLTTLIASYWGTMKILVLLIAVFLSIPVFFLLIKYPNLGFFFMLLGGWFISYKGPGGVNASILMAILMFALWLLDMLIIRRRFEFVHSQALRPAVYFMITSMVAFIAGQIKWFTFANQAPLDAQVGGFAIYFFLVALMIVTANILRNIRWLKAFIWVFVGLVLLFVFSRVVNLPGVNNIYAYMSHANSMFWMWPVALLMGQIIFNNDLKFRYRLLLLAVVAVIFYVAVFQNRDWKSGWVPSIVAVGVLLGLRFRKLAFFAIPFAVIIAGSLVGGMIASDQYSWGTRVDAWIIVLEVSKTSPLIGLGFANYYWYVKLVPIRGYYVNFNSHSQFVDIIAQTGIAGLFCFMWILFEVGRLGWKLMQRLPPGFERGYASGVLAGVFGSLTAAFLGDWLLPFTYNVGLDGVRSSVLPWIFFGALVAVERIHREKSNDENSTWTYRSLS